MEATQPRFRKPQRVTGNNLVLRDARKEDAAFILSLRTDAGKSRFLSRTSSDLAQQEAWLERYAADDGQIYFIIEDRAGAPVGTVRLYDRQGDSFCWGSWILQAGAPPQYAIESALLVYEVGLAQGFTGAHFDVRKGNESVWKFHERFGAVRTGETAEDYLFTISREAIRASMDKYRKYLPSAVDIRF